MFRSRVGLVTTSQVKNQSTCTDEPRLRSKLSISLVVLEGYLVLYASIYSAEHALLASKTRLRPSKEVRMHVCMRQDGCVHPT